MGLDGDILKRKISKEILENVINLDGCVSGVRIVSSLRAC